MITSDDLILHLKKIFLHRIRHRLSDNSSFYIGANSYTKDQFIKILEEPNSTIFGQFIQKMAECGFDIFALGHNVGGFTYVRYKGRSTNPCNEIPLDGPTSIKEACFLSPPESDEDAQSQDQYHR